MELISTPDIFGYTIFCDDVRNEIGGKHSFIGAYTGGVMIVHAGFPVTLPIFAMAVTILQRRGVMIPNLSLRIFMPGDPDDQASIQGELKEIEEGKVAALANAVGLHPAARSDDYVMMSAQIKFTQMVLKEPGMIKVRAVIGDNMYRLGVLQISPPPPVGNEGAA
jgi:hypothetical protein